MKIILALMFVLSCSAQTPKPHLHVLVFYSETVEPDHVAFAHQAIKFYTDAAQRGNYDLTATTNWDDLNAANLAHYQLVMWLNDQPKSSQQRSSFEQYMEHGGGWLGFHVTAYNDRDSHWPWFLHFLGGGVFYGNNWPPLPAALRVDDPTHSVVAGLPATFQSPSNEWYLWRPSPRANKDVRVLITLQPSNYPLGLKDTIEGGDLPVVWTNTRYRMLYMNMGHGDKIFTSDMQNRLFEQAVSWLIECKTKTPQ
jgi:type 1 glutamine amidotransferase